MSDDCQRKETYFLKTPYGEVTIVSSNKVPKDEIWFQDLDEKHPIVAYVRGLMFTESEEKK